MLGVRGQGVEVKAHGLGGRDWGPQVNGSGDRVSDKGPQVRGQGWGKGLGFRWLKATV